jgi:hypothetical protein
MMKKKFAAVLALVATVVLFTQSSAQARGYQNRHSKHSVHHGAKYVHVARSHHRYGYRTQRFARRTGLLVAGSGARPSAWCGWWLGKHLGMNKRDLWLARNWASVGSNAGGPGIGVVVVWRHHVGVITGRSGSGWIVKSGNDGNRVRERVRSIAGAIAFRHVGSSANVGS